LTIFSVTYFYYSNQLTISHLLNLNLEMKNMQQEIAEQVNQLLKSNLRL
jgi:hypothetical protein